MTETVKFKGLFLPSGGTSARAVSVDVEMDKALGPVNDRSLYTLENIEVHYLDGVSTHMPNNYVSPELVEEYQREEWFLQAIGEYMEKYESICDDLSAQAFLDSYRGK